MVTDRYNKVVFNGYNLHDYFRILEIKRSILPSVTNFSKEISGIDGEVYTGTKYDTRKITLSCAIISRDKEDYLDTIKSISYMLGKSRDVCKLVLGDDDEIYYKARLEGSTDLEKIRFAGKFTLEFVCFDPLGYSIESDNFTSNGGTTVIENAGTTSAFPIINVAFNNDAHFLQATNEFDGRSVMIGQPRKISETKPVATGVVLNDSCETLTNWSTIGNIVDTGRTVDGNLIINEGGWGITLGNSGNNANGWHGGGLRRQVGENLKDFRVEVKMTHSSRGDVDSMGGGSDADESTSGKYKITAEPSLRIRAGRGTNYKKLGNIPKGKIVTVTDIQKKWGKTTYNGISGYIYMDYTQKQQETSSTLPTTIQYKVNTKSGLIMRTGRGTKYKKILTIPYNTVVTIDLNTVHGGWGQVTYKDKTGYCSTQYLTQITKVDTGASPFSSTDEKAPSIENKIGMLEIYGFDKNGTKLFKFQLVDEQKWYEYTEPVIQFGSKTMVEDGINCPAPRTETRTENDEKVTYEVDGGTIGDWNAFKGWFTLERVTGAKGQQIWYAKVEKMGYNGKVLRMMESAKVSGDFPTGELNNIVVYMGGYKDEALVDYMNVDEIKVTNLTNTTVDGDETVAPLFVKGDEVLIDSTNQKVYKNGRLLMSKLDMTSRFFTSPSGVSKIICRSDDKEIDVATSIQKRWL